MAEGEEKKQLCLLSLHLLVSALASTFLREIKPAQADDLISFLETAQWLDVDLLSISWQPALDTVSFGGTSEIFQSLVDVKTSFAFKRGSEDFSKDQARHIYQNLKSEITILGHPVVRVHSNVSKLVGVCWDIQHKDGMVYPVLVSEKTDIGDMVAFKNSPEGTALPISEKLALCTQVAEALDFLHVCCMNTPMDFKEFL